MKNIKIALLVFGICAMSTAAYSQVSFGAKGGAGFGAMRIEDKSVSETLDSRNLTNYDVGAYFNFQSNSFFFRPELLYVFKKGRFDNDQIITLHNIQIPLMFGVQLIGPLGIEAGPTYTRILYGHDNFNDGYTIYKNGIGYRFGPNLTFDRLLIYGNMEGNVYKQNGNTRFTEPYRLNLGIGIKIAE